METAGLLTAFGTMAATVFVAELTDKDALVLLSLATRGRSWLVFAAGSVAFSITSAIIVLLGSAVTQFVPVFWIKLAGGIIMLSYSLWLMIGALRLSRADHQGVERLQGRAFGGALAFLAIVGVLIALDLAGDATELLTVVFVAQYRNALLVFVSVVTALVAASGVEAILGNRLGGILSAQRVRYLSIVVFLIVGSLILVTTLAGT